MKKSINKASKRTCNAQTKTPKSHKIQLKFSNNLKNIDNHSTCKAKQYAKQEEEVLESEEEHKPRAGKLKKLASIREDNNSNFSITKNSKLLSLLKQPSSSL